MSDAFFALWADTRGRLPSLSVAELALAIRRLNELAGDARERALIASVEVVGGVATSDEAMVHQGRQRLVAATPEEVSEALSAFSDVTILGTPAQRRRILEHAVFSVAPEDAAVSFLVDPGLASAQAIISGQWEPNETLPTPLARELRRWVAWAAFDAWLTWRRREYRMVALHPSVAFSGEEEGSFEYAILKVLVDLANDDLESSCKQLARLQRTRRSPHWALARARHLCMTYSPLAGPDIERWIDALPGAGADGRASVAEPTERAGYAFPGLVGTNKHTKFLKVKDDVTGAPWIVFCYFISVAPGVVARELAAALFAGVKRPDDILRWPWQGRARDFADACVALEDRALALQLLALSLGALPGNPQLSAACVTTLSSCGPAELVSLQADPELSSKLGDSLGRLPESKRMMLHRGGVWRAVVDGTNVAFGGRSKAAGVSASLALVARALDSLQSAGFEEIIVWFDASTRHHLDQAEAKELATWQARGKASIVPQGPADVAVIEDFLADPTHSWIVTNDRFRDWRSRYPSLDELSATRQLRFSLEQTGRIRWSRRLDGSDG